MQINGQKPWDRTLIKQLTFVPQSSTNPNFAIDASDNLHVVWQDDREGPSNIFYKKLDNSGNNVTDDIRLTDIISFSSRPRIAVDASQNLHVVWSDGRDGNPEIYYKKLNDSGVEIIPDKRITNNTGMSNAPALGIDSTGEIALTWADNSEGNSEIYFARLDNDGNRLTGDHDDMGIAFDVQVSDAPGISQFVALAMEEETGYSNVVWSDNRILTHTTQVELYYSKLGKMGGTIVPDTRLTNQVNVPPIADGGPDQNVEAGVIVTLNGTNSSDPDNLGEFGTMSYAWKQVAGEVVTLVGPGSAIPTFIAPSNNIAGNLIFELVVNDSTDPSPPDTVNISVAAIDSGFIANGTNFLDELDRPDLHLQEFSLASWFMTSQDFTSNSMIVNKGGFGAGENMNYGLYLDWGERVKMVFESTDGTNYFVTSPNSYNDGNAHYAVATFDLSILKLYVDGSIVATLSTTAIPDDGSSRPVRIAANSAAENEFFNGSIDEVRIWNRTLTDQEVSDQYNSAIFDTAGQVLYRDMSEPLNSTKPNIILIYTDDQRWDTLNLMPTVKNKLAGEGVEFSNSFVTTALCCPSRASILTGQYTHNHGVLTNVAATGGGAANFNDASTLATWLDDEGYTTSFVGKYLNGYHTMAPYIPPGWNDWHVIVRDLFYNYTLTENGTMVDFGDSPSDYSTDVLRDRAIDFVSNAEPPYFLMLSFLAPHADTEFFGGTGNPIPAPRHLGTCDDLEPHRPPSFNEADVSDKPNWIKSLPILSEEEIADIDQFRKDQICSLKAVDEAISSILDALEPNLDDTVIIFTSDNGELWGEHRFHGKFQIYEEAVRVPLVIRYPSLIPEAVVNDAFVLNIDLAPMIAELAGATPTIPVNGDSLVDLFNEGEWRDDFLIEQWRNGEQAAVRTIQFKYAEHLTPQGPVYEFYDLINDPYELNNAINDPSFVDIIANLAERLAILKQE